MQRLLNTSADMKKDISITFHPVNGFQHVRGQFGVVFHEQSNAEVAVHISWHGRRPLHYHSIVKHLMIKWLIIMKVLESLFLNLNLGFFKESLQLWSYLWPLDLVVPKVLKIIVKLWSWSISNLNLKTQKRTRADAIIQLNPPTPKLFNLNIKVKGPSPISIPNS